MTHHDSRLSASERSKKWMLMQVNVMPIVAGGTDMVNIYESKIQGMNAADAVREGANQKKLDYDTIKIDPQTCWYRINPYTLDLDPLKSDLDRGAMINPFKIFSIYADKIMQINHIALDVMKDIFPTIVAETDGMFTFERQEQIEQKYLIPEERISADPEQWVKDTFGGTVINGDLEYRKNVLKIIVESEKLAINQLISPFDPVGIKEQVYGNYWGSDLRRRKRLNLIEMEKKIVDQAVTNYRTYCPDAKQIAMSFAAQLREEIVEKASKEDQQGLQNIVNEGTYYQMDKTLAEEGIANLPKLLSDPSLGLSYATRFSSNLSIYLSGSTMDDPFINSVNKAQLNQFLDRRLANNTRFYPLGRDALDSGAFGEEANEAFGYDGYLAMWDLIENLDEGDIGETVTRLIEFSKMGDNDQIVAEMKAFLIRHNIMDEEKLQEIDSMDEIENIIEEREKNFNYRKLPCLGKGFESLGDCIASLRYPLYTLRLVYYFRAWRECPMSCMVTSKIVGRLYREGRWLTFSPYIGTQAIAKRIYTLLFGTPAGYYARKPKAGKFRFEAPDAFKKVLSQEKDTVFRRTLSRMIGTNIDIDDLDNLPLGTDADISKLFSQIRSPFGKAFNFLANYVPQRTVQGFVTQSARLGAKYINWINNGRFAFLDPLYPYLKGNVFVEDSLLKLTQSRYFTPTKPLDEFFDATGDRVNSAVLNRLRRQTSSEDLVKEAIDEAQGRHRKALKFMQRGGALEVSGLKLTYLAKGLTLLSWGLQLRAANKDPVGFFSKELLTTSLLTGALLSNPAGIAIASSLIGLETLANKIGGNNIVEKYFDNAKWLMGAAYLDIKYHYIKKETPNAMLVELAQAQLNDARDQPRAYASHLFEILQSDLTRTNDILNVRKRQVSERFWNIHSRFSKNVEGKSLLESMGMLRDGLMQRIFPKNGDSYDIFDIGNPFISFLALNIPQCDEYGNPPEDKRQKFDDVLTIMDNIPGDSFIVSVLKSEFTRKNCALGKLKFLGDFFSDFTDNTEKLKGAESRILKGFWGIYNWKGMFNPEYFGFDFAELDDDGTPLINPYRPIDPVYFQERGGMTPEKELGMRIYQNPLQELEMGRLIFF